MTGRFFVNFIRRVFHHPLAPLGALLSLVLLVPLVARALLGWSDPLGYLSDLGTAGLLTLLLYRRPWWLAPPG
uniref:hypothetical protein n=1 Tax=Pseudomonas chlororaphis TaxID=587753 RepID=UPI0021822EFD